MKRLPARLGLLAALVASLALTHPGTVRAEVVDRIVAVVNDEVICQSDLDWMAKSIQMQAGQGVKVKDRAFQMQMLDALINQKLAKAEAKRRGLTVSDKELEAALADFKRQNRLPDEAALNEALGKADMTLNELKQKISDQILQDRLMTLVMGGKTPEIPESEVRRIYETEVPKAQGVFLHLKILTLAYPPDATQAQKDEVTKKAEVILKEHKQGASLEELSKRHSLPLQDLGAIAEADLDPKLAGFLSKLKPKEVGPIQTPQGFQLVELLNRREASGGATRSYEEVAPRIRQALQRQEMAKQFNDYVKGLRQKAHIKIML